MKVQVPICFQVTGHLWNGSVFGVCLTCTRIVEQSLPLTHP